MEQFAVQCGKSLGLPRDVIDVEHKTCLSVLSDMYVLKEAELGRFVQMCNDATYVRDV